MHWLRLAPALLGLAVGAGCATQHPSAGIADRTSVRLSKISVDLHIRAVGP